MRHGQCSNAEWIIVSRNPEAFFRDCPQFSNMPGVCFVVGDVLHANVLANDKDIGAVDAIIHAAALLDPVAAEDKILAASIDGTRHVISLARGATKVMIDVDDAELNKPTFKPDIKILSDAGEFLKMIHCSLASMPPKEEWLDYCRRVKEKYPVILPEHRERTDYVSSYVLPRAVVRHAPDPLTVVTSNGIAYTSTFQSIPIRKGMRMFSNEACASMGYGLPAAIGAAFAGGDRRVVCFEGDGSIQMNLQELQTLKNYNLPVALLVYNNGGYLSIKTTQKAFFGGFFVGSEAGSGVVLPSFEKLAAAYDLPYFRLSTNQELDEKLPEIFAVNGPVVVEVLLDPFEVLGPKAASKRLPDGTMVSEPLDNMAPFLPEEERVKWMLPKQQKTRAGA